VTNQLPQHSKLIKGNRDLPSDKKQSMVLLTFGRPIPRALAGDFLRIHLSPAMKGGGEDEFHDVGLAQPHRSGPQRCMRCGQYMRQVSVTGYRCGNGQCRDECGRPSALKTQYAGPLRGVVKLMIAPDFVSHRETKTRSTGEVYVSEWLNRLILVLDRRYHEVVLAAVYRTAGELCDMRGWKLK